MSVRKEHDRDAYTQLGKYLSERHSDQLSTQLSVFQSALINFASEHGEEITRNPEFRAKFTQMCQLVGVDPLELLIYSNASNKWTNVEKNDNFYVGLSVRIVEVCQQTRDVNGGLISMKELVSRVPENVNLKTSITENDILKALGLLDTLGNGYEIIRVNDHSWLKYASASSSGNNGNISNDQRKVHDLCGFMGGYVTYRLLRDNYGWDKLRCKSVIDDMIMNGFLWVDAQGPKGSFQYWEPSWISN